MSFEVQLTENTLTVNVKLKPAKTKNSVQVYDLNKVINQLKNKGYDVKPGDCIKGDTVRNDYGTQYLSGTWRFRVGPKLNVQTPTEKVTKPSVTAPFKTVQLSSKRKARKTAPQTKKNV